MGFADVTSLYDFIDFSKSSFVNCISLGTCFLLLLLTRTSVLPMEEKRA